jgi:hypothetical protein
MYGKPYRGFESLSLRHVVCSAEKSAVRLSKNRAKSPAIRDFFLLKPDNSPANTISQAITKLMLYPLGLLIPEIPDFCEGSVRTSSDQFRWLQTDSMDLYSKREHDGDNFGC